MAEELLSASTLRNLGDKYVCIGGERVYGYPSLLLLPAPAPTALSFTLSCEDSDGGVVGTITVLLLFLMLLQRLWKA
jgi:hypothetical protein